VRLPLLLLGLCLAAPLAAQEKNVQPKFGAQKPEPKAQESTTKGRKHAEKKPEKKPEQRGQMVQKGPSNAKIGSTVDQYEVERNKKAAEKRK
jgi:hypothetical protein